MQVLYFKSGEATDGVQNIILMMRMEEKLTPINLKTWASWTVSGYLKSRVQVKQVHIGTPAHTRDRVFWKGKRTQPTADYVSGSELLHYLR